MMALGSVLLFFLLPVLSLCEVSSFSRCSQFFVKGTHPTVLTDSSDNNRYAQICQCLLDQNQRPNYFFATLYDTRNKIPVYSAYELSRADVDRTDPWYVEPQLDGVSTTCMATQGTIPSGDRGRRQALNNDYEGSGYDKGHLYPVYHTGTQDEMLATSTLTNAAPQNPTFNRGQWKLHEENLTKVVQDNGCSTAYVVTGVVPSNQQIGNGVRVAQYYWTALCCVGGGLRTAGYIGPNNNGQVESGTLAWLENQLTQHYGTSFSAFQNAC